MKKTIVPLVRWLFRNNMRMQMYYNPKCGTCRNALQLLKEKGADVEIIEYLKHPPTRQELKEVLKKLGLSPKDIIRAKEPLYKEKIEGKNLSDEELISLMAEHPILIERPILIEGSRAIIGRPAEKVLELAS